MGIEEEPAAQAAGALRARHANGRVESVAFARGATLLEALRAAGIVVLAPCGGGGTCGRCEVTLADDDATGGARRVLACQTPAADGMEVLLDDLAAMSIEEGFGNAAHRVGTAPGADTAPAANASPVPMAGAGAGSPEDATARTATQEEADAANGAAAGTEVSREPAASAGRNAASGAESPGGASGVTAQEAADYGGTRGGAAADDGRYGLAVDIGTTTLAFYLVDLADLSVLETTGALNPQAPFGADVIARIDAASDLTARATLRDGVRSAITHAATELCARRGIDPARLERVSCAGNTVMESLVAGIDPAPLGVAPFTPPSLFGAETDLSPLASRTPDTPAAGTAPVKASSAALASDGRGGAAAAAGSTADPLAAAGSLTSGGVAPTTACAASGGTHASSRDGRGGDLTSPDRAASVGDASAVTGAAAAAPACGARTDAPAATRAAMANADSTETAPHGTHAAPHGACAGDPAPAARSIPALGHAYLTPAVAAYVGGDITAGLHASGMRARRGLQLFVDIGTNGEMALGNAERVVCCATAAGPAFEGAGISFGMPALPGAIEAVILEEDRLRAHVIGEGAARGLCGSGLLDAVACLLDAGLIDETGYLLDADEAADEAPAALAALIGEEDGQTVCYLDPARSVWLSQADVRQTQLAKAAIRAGIEVLMASLGVTAADVEELALAGGFGTHLRIESAARIGLIPPALAGRTTALGNAAGRGAVAALTDEGRADLAAIAAVCEYRELSGDAAFNNAYIEAMGFEEDTL